MKYMREIKFRAWDSKNDVMRDWDYMRTSWTLGILNGDSRTEIMQFTGLKDKNGKEIYEGDVVRFWQGEHRECVEAIQFGNGVFGTDASTGTAPITECMTKDDVIDEHIKVAEVIGNIYENPELLK